MLCSGLYRNSAEVSIVITKNYIISSTFAFAYCFTFPELFQVKPLPLERTRFSNPLKAAKKKLYYRPNACPVAQPSVLKHWRVLEKENY